MAKSLDNILRSMEKSFEQGEGFNHICTAEEPSDWEVGMEEARLGGRKTSRCQACHSSVVPVITSSEHLVVQEDYSTIREASRPNINNSHCKMGKEISPGNISRLIQNTKWLSGFNLKKKFPLVYKQLLSNKLQLQFLRT